MPTLSRNKKINKLGAAIREYRGLINPITKKWITPPDPSAFHRMRTWLSALGRPSPEADIETIKALPSMKAYREFMSSL